MRRVRWTGLLLLGVLALCAGCNILGAVMYMLHPPNIQKAEYKLTEGRLAVFVESKRPEQYNPLFVDALQARLKQIFQEEKIRAELVPQEEILRLRQENPDFNKWSIQKVGQKLDVPLVLSLRIDDFQLKATAAMPVIEPAIHLHMKLIRSSNQGEARVWPAATGPMAEREGHEVSVTRPAVEASSPMVLDEQAVKLAKDTAWEVAKPFYNVDLEKPHLREPD